MDTRLVKDLLMALVSASAAIQEMGCTCVDRTSGHQKDCSGSRAADKYQSVINRAKASISNKVS